MRVSEFTNGHRLAAARVTFELPTRCRSKRKRSNAIGRATAIVALVVPATRRDIAAVPNLKKQKRRKNKWNT